MAERAFTTAASVVVDVSKKYAEAQEKAKRDEQLKIAKENQLRKTQESMEKRKDPNAAKGVNFAKNAQDKYGNKFKK